MKKLLLLVCAVMFMLGLSGCSILDFYSESPHRHSFDEWVVTKRATCTEDGERERYCSCGDKQTGVIASLGHDIVNHEGLAASCTNDGYEEYKTCSRCEYTTKTVIYARGHNFQYFYGQKPTCTQVGFNAYKECRDCGFSDYEEIPQLNHNFGEWIEITAATCTEKGEQVRRCANDETHTETRRTDMLEHTASDWIISTNPTCEEKGLKYKQCTECETVLETEDIQPHSHDYGEWVEISAPTCSEEGLMQRVCSYDNSHVQTKKIETLDHTSSGWITESEPDCETDGLRYKNCTVCLTRIDEENIPKTGHEYGEWQLIEAPACSTDGEERRVCLNNENHFEVRAVTAKGHSYIMKYDESNHFRQCEICGDSEEGEAHTAGEVCTVCGYIYSDFVFKLDGESYTLVKYRTEGLSDIIIPEYYNGIPVTAIAPYAFRNYSSVTKITVPACIEEIGEGAFSGCSNLESLTLPFMGRTYDDKEGAFLGILFGAGSYTENGEYVPAALKSVRITGKITSVPAMAFSGCGSLTEIVLPDSVEIIGDNAFYLCTALTEFVLPKNTVSIGSHAFYSCSALKSLTLSESVKIIDLKAFCGCGLDSVIFENTEGWAIYKAGEIMGDIAASLLSDPATSAKYLTEYFSDYIWKQA